MVTPVSAQAHAAIRAAIVVACAERGWDAPRLAREARIKRQTAHSLLDGGRAHGRTIAAVAAALGIPTGPDLLSDRPRDTSRIGRRCSGSEVDMSALRYVLRELCEVPMPHEGRCLVADAGRLAGMPAGWETAPIEDFGA